MGKELPWHVSHWLIGNRRISGSRMKICLVSHNAAGAFSMLPGGHIGGVERQTAMFAKYLASRGHDVSVITWSETGAERDEQVDGVCLIRLCAESDGFPIVRFIWPRWTSLLGALRRADAEVYYHNAAEAATGQIALWARLNRRKFVYSVASEPACHNPPPTLKHRRERALYGKGVRKADSIIVQTNAQKRLLESEWGVASTMIPMPADISVREERNSKLPATRPRALWIGRVVRVKRVEWLLEMAEMCPDIDFDIVGAFVEDDYKREVLEKACSIGNVVWHGRIPFDDVGRFYARASLLICTSIWEGFPNTFLEAMANGVPIVTTFDPDGIISDKQLGGAAKSPDQLAEVAHGLVADTDAYTRTRRNCMRYFNETHRSDMVLPKFEEHLLHVALSGTR